MISKVKVARSQMLAHKSRTKSLIHTKIGAKVATPMGNIVHQFQGQKVTRHINARVAYATWLMWNRSPECHRGGGI